MRIALINSSKKSPVYPIALLKIGAWLKSQGHKCKLFNRLPTDNIKYDEIWISTLFTFEIPYVMGMIREAKKRYKVIKVGGIAASLLPEKFEEENVEVTIGRIKGVEEFAPDYSLLKEKPKYSIAYLSRGCVRKCKFCMVPKLEPKFENSREDLKKGMKRVVKEKNILKIDFNQALDCRLMTEKKADLIQDLPIHPFRFAFDGMHQDGHWQKATKMMIDRGCKKFVNLVLYNFKDTPEDFYYRLRKHAEFTYKYKVECSAFPMKYKPVLNIRKQKRYVGINWTKKELSGFNAMIGSHSGNGVMGIRNRMIFDYNAVKEFEYFYAKDEKDFKRLLNYENIYDLCRRRSMQMIIKPKK